jgi:hypothetical protein
MEEKELKALLEQVDGKVSEGMKAVTAGLLKVEDFEAKLNEWKVSDLTIKEVVDAVTSQGVELKKIIESQSKPTEKESVSKIITKVFPDIVKVVEGNGGRYKIKIDRSMVSKTAVSLTSITSDPNGMILPDMAMIQSQANNIAPSLNVFQLTPDDHGIIYWVDQTTRTNNAAARSDGSAAAEQVYAWTGYSETVDNVSAMVPAHKEALKHISVMQQTINALLTDDCLVALDGYCYTGTGTAPQIGGIYTRATAFAPATYIAAGGFTPKHPTIYDLVVSMAAQIEKATKYVVDKVWLNPYDVTRLRLAKNNDGDFLFPQYAMGNGAPLYIGRIQVVEANSVTVNTCVVGESKRAMLYQGGVELDIGYDLTGDFSKRIVTILANMEASLVIRNAEVNAFLSSTDIGADIVALAEQIS